MISASLQVRRAFAAVQTARWQDITWLHSLLWHVSERKWFFTVLHVARNAPLSTPGDRYQQQYL